MNLYRPLQRTSSSLSLVWFAAAGERVAEVIDHSMHTTKVGPPKGPLVGYNML